MQGSSETKTNDGSQGSKMAAVIAPLKSPDAIAARPRPPLWINVPGQPVNLHGILNGAAVFLIAGGPSFLKVDLRLLRLPGCFTMGMNNSPKTFRPNFWISVDEPSKFLSSIWHDPKITKFVRDANRSSRLLDSGTRMVTDLTPEACPNVIFYNSNLNFKPQTFLNEDSVSWGRKDGKVGRSVMLAALKTLFHLGAAHVFLLGVDFLMSESSTYHFAQKRSRESVKGNLETYHQLSIDLETLQPQFLEAGFHVWNCNPISALKVFPFISFHEAVEFATASMPSSIEDESTEGLYDRVEGENDSAYILASTESLDRSCEVRRVDRSKRPQVIHPLQDNSKESSPPDDSGILLLCDNNLEWAIPWWFHHYDKSGTDLQVAICDTGMGELAIEWLKNRGIRIESKSREQFRFEKAWFNKPFAIASSPFMTTLFSDIDCEIRGDISPMCSWASLGVVLGNDLHPQGNCRKLFRHGLYYNSGLIGVEKGNPILQAWCNDTLKLHRTLRSDQEILNLSLYESEATIVQLPPHFHQLRLDGEHPEALVMHWTGHAGNAHIKKEIEKLGIVPIS